MREFEASGKTIDEAIQNGLKKLGVSRDDVSIEVLRTPQRGFLGIGGQDAVVKLTLTGILAQELEKMENAASADEPAKEEKRPERTERPREKRGDRSFAKADRAEKKEETKEALKEEAPEMKIVMPDLKRKDEEDLPPVSAEKAEHARKFLGDLFEKMGVSVAPESVNGESGRLEVTLEGEDLGVIIGRRGETLDAIQYLTSVVINRGSGEYTRVSIDAQNYRQKREETLVRLATRLAGKVKNSRRNMTLEPMTAYERRIIHATIQGIDGVTTFSTGSEPNRRVVITLEGRERKR